MRTAVFQYFFSVSALLCSLLMAPALVAQTATDPEFVVIRQEKPANCPSGGLSLVEGYVKANRSDAFVEVVVYIQQYDDTWVRKVIKRRGSGIVKIEAASCNYTGNYYTFSRYQDKETSFPTVQQVMEMHKKKGEDPLFRVTKRKPLPGCPNGETGTFFQEGQVFTPKGETVEIIFFMEKKDGSWRKKAFNHTGSGFIDINIADCELTGKYKTMIKALR